MTAIDYPSTVQLLLDRGADVNVRNNAGYTALMLAARDGQVETVRLLLRSGADASIKATDGASAFSLAKKKKEIEILELLKRAAER